MLKITGTTIELTCGDSAIIAVMAVDNDGQRYTFQPSDQVVFSLKATNKKIDNNLLLQKVVQIEEENQIAYIELESGDTKDLDFKKYFYDIQLITGDNWVQTIIPNATFKVGVEIG